MFSDTSILLITIDSVRADHMGFMDYHRRTTPNVDRFIEESVVFTNAFAAGPRTPESFPGILASADPLMYGDGFGLTARHTTLAELLRQSNYITGGFHSNPYLSSAYSYHKGFDVFYGPSDFTDFPKPVSAVHHTIKNTLGKAAEFLYPIQKAYRIARLLKIRLNQNWEPFTRASVLNREVISWLTNVSGKFFLWLHYMDPHLPYLPDEEHLRLFRSDIPSKKMGRKLMSKVRKDPDTLSSFSDADIQLCIDMYDAEIRYTDQWMGNLFKFLKECGIYDQLLIIVAADHGEEFGEHGSLSHGKRITQVKNGAVQVKLYDELLHVPLLIRLPRAKCAGKKVEALVSLVDLPVTIAELLGIQPSEDWIGKSFLSTIVTKQDGRECLFGAYQVQHSGLYAPVVACRTKIWKYIYDGMFGRHELYHLPADPREQNNVISEYPNQAAALKGKVLEYLSRVQTTEIERTQIDLNEELQVRLRELGYLD